jgi:stage II sporulation protein AA (anti-sigma F factor antagonist)
MSIYRHLGVWKHGDVTVVRFGEHRILDELAVKKIGDELNGVADRADCRNLVLHFASVVGLSSLMLGKLLMLEQKMASKGGKLTLCEIEPEVQEVFASTKLNHILDIRESEDDAIRAFAGDTHASLPTTGESG